MYNPFFALDNPTIVETIEAIKIAICEIIKTNQEQQVVIDKLNNYLADIDETVKEEVTKVIEEMYESGELADIIADIVADYMNKHQFKYMATLPQTRILRDLHEFGYTKIASNTNDWYAGWLQGCCVYKVAGASNVRFAGAYKDMRKLTYNNVVLEGYTNVENVNSRYTGGTTYSYGHANGMCYNSDDGFLYVAPSTRLNPEGSNTTVYDYHIYKVSTDFTNSTAKNLLNFVADDGLDIENNFHTSDIAFFNNKLYVINDIDHSNMKVYELDFENEILHYVITIQPKTELPFYNWDIENNIVFFVDTFGKNIQLYNFETGEFLWNYKIPQSDYNNCYLIKEIEGISVMENGDIYLPTCQIDGLGTTSSILSTTSKISIFKCNYLKNVVKDNYTATSDITSLTSEAGGKIVYVKPHYVDTDLSGHANDTDSFLEPIQTNPSGTLTNPFESIAEAVEFINTSNQFTHCDIYLLNNHRLITAISSNKNIRIAGRLNNVNNTAAETGGLYLRSTTNIELRYLNNYNGSELMTDQASLFFNVGKACIYHCNFSDNSSSIYFASTYATTILGSVVVKESNTVIDSVDVRESSLALNYTNDWS